MLEPRLWCEEVLGLEVSGLGVGLTFGIVHPPRGRGGGGGGAVSMTLVIRCRYARMLSCPLTHFAKVGMDLEKGFLWGNFLLIAC